MPVKLDHVDKYFTLNGERFQVLADICLAAREAEFVALLGPSGCGKSTLLELLMGFYPPDGGRIETQGKLSLMPQQDMLLPWRNVLENACLPAEIRTRGGQKQLAAQREEIRTLLPLFGLEGFAGAYPAMLSGGMRQRAALLRTYLHGGDFWLLDEPFAKLDALSKEELQEWFWGIANTFRPGVLLVTHDIDEALRLAERIILFSPRPGRIIDEVRVPPDLRAQPRLQLELKQEIRERLRRGSNAV